MNKKEKRFNKIILKLQELRLNSTSFNYEENNKELIHYSGKEIKENQLIKSCKNITFATQLCIMNCIPFEYFD